MKSFYWIMLIELLILSACAGPETTKAPGKEALFRPGTVFKDCEVCPQMVVLPDGTYEMGSEDYRSERPAHTVTIGYSFAVGRYEVTFDEWDACVREYGCTGYSPNDNKWGRGRRPVIDVTWLLAKSYVDWLSEKTGKPYRLLSESEWEYAARGGSQKKFWWGDRPEFGRANCKRCSAPPAGEKTLPVGSFEPNGFGLFDTAGNVSEWVEDCILSYGFNNPAFDAVKMPPADGSPVTDCKPRYLRIIRGGAWRDSIWAQRSTFRTAGTRSMSIRHLGFRIARGLD